VCAYALSAVFQGIIGGLYAIYNCYIDPPTVYAFSISINQIGATYLGGAGTLYGPVVGAVVTTILSEYSRYSLGVMVEGLNNFIYAVIIVCVLLFMPEGIVGRLTSLKLTPGIGGEK
jgi:branched-chain amino acid transport system permease protein